MCVVIFQHMRAAFKGRLPMYVKKRRSWHLSRMNCAECLRMFARIKDKWTLRSARPMAGGLRHYSGGSSGCVWQAPWKLRVRERHIDGRNVQEPSAKKSLAIAHATFSRSQSCL